MDGCWGTSHPNGATSGPKGPEMTDNKVKGKQMKNTTKERSAKSFTLQELNSDYIPKLYWELYNSMSHSSRQDILANYWLNTELITVTKEFICGLWRCVRVCVCVSETLTVAVAVKQIVLQ